MIDGVLDDEDAKRPVAHFKVPGRIPTRGLGFHTCARYYRRRLRRLCGQSA